MLLLLLLKISLVRAPRNLQHSEKPSQAHRRLYCSFSGLSATWVWVPSWSTDMGGVGDKSRTRWHLSWTLKESVRNRRGGGGESRWKILILGKDDDSKDGGLRKWDERLHGLCIWNNISLWSLKSEVGASKWLEWDWRDKSWGLIGSHVPVKGACAFFPVYCGS